MSSAQEVRTDSKSTTARWASPRPTALEASLSLFLTASVLDAGLWLFLYLRPSPLGVPFALDPAHYVFHAMYYSTWAQLLVALPFLLRAAYWRGHGDRIAFAAQATLTCALLTVGAIDREFQRFLGTHLTLSWLGTYTALDRTPAVIWLALARDQGGAWSSLMGLGAVLSYLVLGPTVARRVRYATLRAPARASFVLCFVVLPTVLWNWVPGGKLRQAKVRPALLLALRELTKASVEPPEPGRLKQAIETYQRHAQQIAGAAPWHFVGADFPLRKRYLGAPPSAPAVPLNFIFLSLETFRAKDMKSMNAALSGPAPTPFLDRLANDRSSAFWRRYYASGVPTVHAFMALHASLIMHPNRSIPSEATTDRIEGFPEILRAHGYRTMHFTGSDPDWDSQRVWLNRWYDEVHYDPDDGEQDRLTFRRAARRIREVGRSERPFLAYLASITNHTPFHTPEPRLSLGPSSTTIEHLHETMHYTDDVVRELYESLQNEPWFANTVWIIVGDHGFDLGERGEAGGHDNLRHETTWIPLIIHGADSRLPRGQQACVGSHVDIAPTILELAGIWDDNSFIGHSLLSKNCTAADAIVARGRHYAYEAPALSLFHAADGPTLAFAPDDLLQANALPAPVELARSSAALVAAYQDVVRYAVDADRISPPRISSLAPTAQLELPKQPNL